MTKLEKYNDSNKHIHVVYAYEIPEYKTCYIGRTKELIKRHKSHCCGKKHSDGRITYDSLYKFCIEKNIVIPDPIIKEDNLNAEESLIKEDYWVNEYCKNGWNLLNKAKTGIKSGSLGHIKVWDYETCKEECKKYKTRQDLRKNSLGCYGVCIKNGWLYEFITEEGKHPNGYWKVKENVINESKKYETISEFITNACGAYKSAKENGWLEELTFKYSYKPPVLKFEEVWNYYQECGNIKYVTSKFKTSYKTLKKLFEENGKKMGNHNRKDPQPHEYEEIQKLLDDGISMREIERKYNITRKRIPKIFKIKNGEK